MTPKIDVITIGATDLQRSREFYEKGLGGAVQEEPNQALSVGLGGSASRLAVRAWDAVAAEAGVSQQSSGFRGFTLSYIVESAEEVDELLARAQRHGSAVSKPPKNAVWGYSAYLTDPSGYLWKIASSKRRPLIARNASSVHNGRVIQPQEVPITIGVADMKRAKQFYEDGLGLPIKKNYRKFVMFTGQDGTSDLGIYKREALADDAAVPAEGSGFRGFTITHLAHSAERVDEVLGRAAQAGGTIVKPPLAGPRGEYGGYFADLDGNLWNVASSRS